MKFLSVLFAVALLPAVVVGGKKKMKASEHLAKRLEGFWKGIDDIVGESSRDIRRNGDGTLFIKMYNTYLPTCGGTDAGVGMLPNATVSKGVVEGTLEIQCLNSDLVVPLPYRGELLESGIYNDRFYDLVVEPDHIFYLHKISK
eukprot:CAMPEP_0197443270 /NCGR_PEP_ID=MMETSP1175-20131217/9045_1 /TAXON_ID=1003142 /ORGANISM="Triceratium dubium, Strain CCMP147" /LENGTH=143 /DNA_ID=CAMNT_0042973875 /DNA_START=46 /DNA_END=477 /DNA_ORIENTATION=+